MAGNFGPGSCQRAQPSSGPIKLQYKGQQQEEEEEEGDERGQDGEDERVKIH